MTLTQDFAWHLHDFCALRACLPVHPLLNSIKDRTTSLPYPRSVDQSRCSHLASRPVALPVTYLHRFILEIVHGAWKNSGLE